MADIRRILLEVSAETGDAERELARLAGEVEGFGRLSADARLGLDASTFRRELAGATAELTAFRAQRAEASLGLDTKGFTAQLAKARAELRALGSSRTEHQVGSLSTSPLSGAISAEREARSGGGGGGSTPPLRSLADDAENDGRRVVRASQDAADSASHAFQGAALNIRSFMTIGMTAVVAAIIAVIPAVVLLGASLVGAAAAAGGLATALAAAAGPALLAIIPLISGVTKVFAAFKVDEQNKQLKQSIIGRQQLANATIQHARAEQQLQIARRDASRGIRDALHADQQATQAVGNAQFDLRIATRDAYRAWQDSINAVTDAMFALKDAQLAVQQAQLTKQQALLDLRNLRKEVAATGTELDHFFNKITEVQLDPKRVAQLLPQVDRLGLTTQQAITVKQKLLDISKANDGIGESEQKRREAEVNLTRAVQRRNEFEQQGLKAYRPLVAAQQAAADASWAQARAAEHLADVQKQGVAHNPQVLAAQDALRTSNQQLTASTNKSKDAWAQVPRALRFLRQPLAELHRAYVNLRTEITRTWAPVIGEGVRGATAFLKTFSGRIAGLANTQAHAAGRLIAGLQSPRAEAFFKRMFGLADHLTRSLTDAFGHLLGFLSNVADAATKPLKRASDAIDKTFTNWDRSTTRGSKGGKRMARIFDEGTTALGQWFHLLGALGQLLLSFFDVTSGQSNSLLGSLTKTVNKWNDWVNSAKGRNAIKDFFAKVMPAAKDTMSALGHLFEVLIAALPTIISLIGTGFSVLSSWLSALTSIYHFFNKLLPSSISAIGTVLLGVLVPLAIVRKAFKTLGSAAEGFGKGLFSGSGLESRAEKFGKSLGARLRKGIGKIFRRGAEDTVANAPAAGETRAAIVEGGTTAAAEMRAAMIQGGTAAAAEIRAAMVTGGLAGAAGGAAEGAAGKTLVDRFGRPLETAAGGAAAGAEGGLAAKLTRTIGPKGLLGGLLRAAVWTDIAVGLGRGIFTGINKGWSEGARAALSSITLGASDKVAEFLGIPSDAQLEAQGRASEAAFQKGQEAARKSRRSGVGFTVDPRTGQIGGDQTTKGGQRIEQRQHVLADTLTFDPSVIERRVRAVIRSATYEFGAGTAKWKHVVKAAMDNAAQSIENSVRLGRLSASRGFSAIERLMRSHLNRGADALENAFNRGQKAIDRFKQSTATKLSESARLARIYLHRMGVSLGDLKKNTDSVNTALATLVANTKLTVKEAKAIIKDAQSLPPPPVVPDSAFDKRKRGPKRVVSTHSRGGLIPGGYGGGDQWPSLLESGEFVLRKEAVRSIGPAVLARLNTNPAGDRHRPVEHHARAFANSVRAIASAGAQSALGDFGVSGGHASAEAEVYRTRRLAMLKAQENMVEGKIRDHHGSGVEALRSIEARLDEMFRAASKTTNIHVSTAPAADQTPDPAILAAQLSLRMRARGLT